MNQYTVKDVSKITGLNERMVRRIAAKNSIGRQVVENIQITRWMFDDSDINKFHNHNKRVGRPKK